MPNTVSSTTYTKDTLQLLREHPGLALIFSYFFLTLMGVAYYHYFYKAFDVPILKLVDFSDIIIAGIREPQIIFMFMATLVVTAIYDWMIRAGAKVQSRLKRQRKTFANRVRAYLVYTPKNNIVIYGLITLFLVYILILMIEILTSKQADQIKKGQSQLMSLTMNSDEDTLSTRTVSVLGSTNNYVIFYDNESKQANVVTIENLVSLSPLPKTDGLPKAEVIPKVKGPH